VRFLKPLILSPIIALIFFANVMAQDSGQRTIAVLDFDNNSIADKEQLEPLSKGLADMLSTEISQIESFKIVERKKLKDLLSEISLGQSGAIDGATAQQVGRLLGAQTLLLGGFVNMFGGKMRMDVRIVEVETGLTLKAEEETGKVDDLFDMVKKLTQKISKYFNVQLSKADKQRLQQHKGGDNLEANLYFSKGIEFEDAGRAAQKAGDNVEAREHYTRALEMFQQAVKKSKEFKGAKDKISEIQSVISGL